MIQRALTGAAKTDLKATHSENSGTIHYELRMTGRRSTIPRDTYQALQGVPYAILEETPSGTLLRVRDFAGCVHYQRWEGCDFAPQEGENNGAGSLGPASLKRAIPPLFAGIDRG